MISNLVDKDCKYGEILESNITHCHKYIQSASNIYVNVVVEDVTDGRIFPNHSQLV
jgi:hypothetical protein